MGHFDTLNALINTSKVLPLYFTLNIAFLPKDKQSCEDYSVLASVPKVWFSKMYLLYVAVLGQI